MNTFIIIHLFLSRLILDLYLTVKTHLPASDIVKGLAAEQLKDFNAIF